MPADALSGPYAQQQKLLLYVLPARLRRRWHRLPDRRPPLLDHLQPVDDGPAVLRDPQQPGAQHRGRPGQGAAGRGEAQAQGLCPQVDPARERSSRTPPTEPEHARPSASSPRSRPAPSARRAAGGSSPATSPATRQAAAAPQEPTSTNPEQSGRHPMSEPDERDRRRHDTAEARRRGGVESQVETRPETEAPEDVGRHRRGGHADRAGRGPRATTTTTRTTPTTTSDEDD